jgi:predicted phage terminase large subunit-like protein
MAKSAPDTAAIAAQAVESERARRCIEKSTLHTAWLRSPTRYQPTAFARSISGVCDQIVSDVIHRRSTWWALEAPPRHGKTEHVGRVLPARVMALVPSASVLYATSTDDRADEASMSARAMVSTLTGAYPHLTPGEVWTRTNWLTEGGGRFVAVGAGVATGGIGSRLTVVDDVTGSAERQRSKAWKSGNRRWMLEDVLTRSEGGPVVVMETRRGIDDLSGWMETEFPGKLRRVTWRCRAVAGEDDPLGREPGAFLWPERYGESWHADQPHLRPGTPIWESLYQQRPTREGGSVILDVWLSHRYAGSPVEAARTCRDIVICVDPAAKTANHNDPTGIVIMGQRPRGGGHDVLILHVEAERRESPVTEQRIADLAAEWTAATRQRVTVLVEDTSVGQAWIPTLRARGLTVIGVGVSGKGDKVARMHPHLSRWAAGEVQLPEGQRWVASYTGELGSVPDAEHDDQWDATAIGLTWYAERAHGRTPSAADILAAMGAQ